MKEVDLGGPKWPSDFDDATPADSAPTALRSRGASRDCPPTRPGRGPRALAAREEG